MDYIAQFMHILLHLNVYIVQLINYFGAWSYVILFLIIFCECGIIFTPFLPGESMLFALGTIAAQGAFHLHGLVLVLISGAIFGGFFNFWVGSKLGRRWYQKTSGTVFHQYLMKTHVFYERHGGKTILIARLLPIIRTYAPFVAGIAHMNKTKFFWYNILGGVLWITGFIYISYYFGNIPLIKNNFSWVILGIVIISVLPAAIVFIKHQFSRKTQASNHAT